MKKKILMLAVAACLIVLSLASSSLAYFTDTAEMGNVEFTSGEVEIELAYTPLTDNKAVPGHEYIVNATVKVTNDSEAAYVGAKIVFTTTNTDTDVAFPTDFLNAFGLTAVNSITGTNDAGQKTITVYVVNNTVLNANGTWKVLEKAKIPYAWTNADMKVFNELNISVTAYAVQAEGNSNAQDALATAFSDNNFKAPVNP